MSNVSKPGRPTEGELEILNILWERGSATVRDVHEELCKTKEAGYTTSLKLMQIMAEKGMVTRNTAGKTHIYMPAISREKTQKHFLNKMISNLFSGSRSELVLQALGTDEASEAELAEIEQLISNLKAKRQG